MKRFRKKGEAFSTRLSPAEVALLTSLCDQLGTMLTDLAEGSPEPADAATEDPFARWAAELAAEPTGIQPPADPAMRRLFPDAYTGDETASSEFRRLTQRDQRDTKLRDLHVIQADLATTEGGELPLSIDRSHVDAWLKTLTALRLTIATRLGISTSVDADELHGMPDDDPRAFLNSVYDWLGFAQESLVQAL